MGHFFFLGEERLNNSCSEGHNQYSWAIEIGLDRENSTQNWVDGYQKWILEECVCQGGVV